MTDTANQRVLWTTVAYTGDVVEYRKRNPTPMRFAEVIPVSIQELPLQDTPVACEVDCVLNANTSIHYRWDGESFWRPLFDKDSVSPMTYVEFERRSKHRKTWEEKHVLNGVGGHSKADPENWMDWPFPRKVYAGHKMKRYEDPFLLGRKEECSHKWKGDNLEEMKVKAIDAASQIAIIGDHIYRKSSEPYIELSLNSYAPKIHVLPKYHTLNQEVAGASETKMTFRLDRLHLAKHAGEIAVRKYNGKEVALSNDAIKVFLPEAFRKDDLLHAGNLFSTEFFSQTKGSVGHLANIEAIIGWGKLKVERNRFLEEGVANLEPMLDALDQFLALDISYDDEEVLIGMNRTPYSYSNGSIERLRLYKTIADECIRPLINEHAPHALNDLVL